MDLRIGTVLASWMLLVGSCGGSTPPPAPSGPVAKQGQRDEPSVETGGETPTIAEDCARWLSRWGEAAKVEQQDCVRATTTGDARASCRERGFEADYDRCFPSCMQSLAIKPDEYREGDAVANCEGGCGQTCDPEHP